MTVIPRQLIDFHHLTSIVNRGTQGQVRSDSCLHHFHIKIPSSKSISGTFSEERVAISATLYTSIKPAIHKIWKNVGPVETVLVLKWLLK